MSSLEAEAQFPAKLAPLFQPKRYKILKGGRGGAKSWGVARALLLMGAERKLRILCGREVQQSIRDSVHKLLSDQIQQLGLGHRYEVMKSEIIGKNGTEFLFAGLSTQTAESIKSYEGVDICWIEEGQALRKKSWEILIPTIRKPDSEIWVTFNPELETDEVYQRFIVNTPPDAVVIDMNWKDNPWFPEVLKQEMEHLRATDYPAYENIWEGKCRAAVSGAIYAKEIAACKARQQITAVPYDPSRLVFTAWDLGRGDSTAIWFWQHVNREFRVIDYEEANGEHLTYYLQRLKARGYKYDTAYLPHDADNETLAAEHTVAGLMRVNNFKVRVLPRLTVEEGINAGRMLFAKAQIDEKRCAAGLEALRRYRWGWNQALNEAKPSPVHDQYSHGADAWRYMALAAKNDPDARPPKPLPMVNTGVLRI